jgi:hypothetical protein
MAVQSSGFTIIPHFALSWHRASALITGALYCVRELTDEQRGDGPATVSFRVQYTTWYSVLYMQYRYRYVPVFVVGRVNLIFVIEYVDNAYF